MDDFSVPNMRLISFQTLIIALDDLSLQSLDQKSFFKIEICFLISKGTPILYLDILFLVNVDNSKASVITPVNFSNF